MNDNTTITTNTNTTNNNTSNNDFDGNELSNHDDNENNTIPEITKVYTPKDVYDIVRNDKGINELILALHQGENHINWYSGNNINTKYYLST